MCLEAGDRVRAGLFLFLPDLPETSLSPILRSQALGHLCSGAMGSVTSALSPPCPLALLRAREPAVQLIWPVGL